MFDNDDDDAIDSDIEGIAIVLVMMMVEGF
jgi:hypothetical protein